MYWLMFGYRTNKFYELYKSDSSTMLLISPSIGMCILHSKYNKIHAGLKNGVKLTLLLVAIIENPEGQQSQCNAGGL